jgi:hypothetical protein
MVYLVIKELSTIAEDVIMVTSSIMKDMQPNLEVVYRPNAIRALARIIDVSTLADNTDSSPNPSNQSRGSSSLLWLTARHPSPLLHLFRLTTCSLSHRLSSSAGRTKLKKPSTQRLFPTPRTHHPLPLHTFPAVTVEDTPRLPARATSCSTTLWVCCTSSVRRTGWQLQR